MNTDYGLIQTWGLKEFDFFSTSVIYVKSQMAQGRFFPLEQIVSLLRQKFIPQEPVYFRAYQMTLMVIATVSLNDFLKSLKISGAARAFSLALVLTNLSMKEWINYSAAAEAPATTCFMIALALYARTWKYVGVLFFFASFLFKESHFVTFGAIPALEYLMGAKSSKRQWGPSILGMVGLIGFVIFVLTLPRVYTAGKFTSFPPLKLIAAFFIPAAKSFGPALAIPALFLFQKETRLKREQLMIMLIGFLIAAPITALLCGWYYHTGWGYTNIVIPFGWAIGLAALWPKNDRFNERSILIISIITSCYLLTSTLRGSHARWLYSENYQRAADIACEESKRIPNLRIFTTLVEGAGGLMSYLKLYNPQCSNPPQIESLNPDTGLPPDVKPPYIVLKAEKWADMGFDESKMQITHRVDLKYWNILKNYSNLP